MKLTHFETLMATCGAVLAILGYIAGAVRKIRKLIKGAGGFLEEHRALLVSTELNTAAIRVIMERLDLYNYPNPVETGSVERWQTSTQRKAHNAPQPERTERFPWFT